LKKKNAFMAYYCSVLKSDVSHDIMIFGSLEFNAYKYNSPIITIS
jgi:hypothetical protein